MDKNDNMAIEQGDKFDLIILASTLHELNLQDAIGAQAPAGDASSHDGETQGKLNTLYASQVEALTAEIEDVLKQPRGDEGDRKIRVLDIGCGQFPYGTPLIREWRNGRIGQLELWDSCKSLGKLGPLAEALQIKNEVLKDLDALKELLGDPREDKGERDFLRSLFAAIKDRLNPGGVLLLSEFYYPKYLLASDHHSIAKTLQLVVKHGDPPEAFFDPDAIILAAEAEGFAVERVRRLCAAKSYEQSPFQDIADEKWGILSRREYAILFLRNPMDVCHPSPEIKRELRAKRDPEGFFAAEVEAACAAFLPRLPAVKRILKAEIQFPLRRDQVEPILFRVLTPEIENMAELSQKFIDTWNAVCSSGALSYSAVWISLSSRLLAEGREDYERLNTLYRDLPLGEGKNPHEQKDTGRLYRSYTYIRQTDRSDDRLKPLWRLTEPQEKIHGDGWIWRGEDWSSIAYNYLLVPNGIAFNDEHLSMICGPSLHRWLAALSARLATYTPKDPDDAENLRSCWKRSVSICCLPFEAEPQRFQAIVARQLGEEALPLRPHIVWEWTKNRPSHIPADDWPYHVGESLDKWSYNAIKADIEKIGLKLRGFCQVDAEDESWPQSIRESYEKMMRSIASVFYDFVLLGRDVQWVTSLSLEKQKDAAFDKLRTCLDRFHKRWSPPGDSSQLAYVSTGKELADAVKRNVTCVLPEGYALKIKTACKRARIFIDELESLTMTGTVSPHVHLPAAMLTISLGEPGSNAPLPSFMTFSDRLLAPRCIDRVADLLRDLTIEYLAMEDSIYAGLKKSDELQRGLVETFGHDATRPARVIKALAQSGCPNEQKLRLIKVMAEDAEIRYSSYACLIDDVQVKARLVEQANPKRVLSWTDLKNLWLWEVMIALVRVLVDTREWSNLREELWPRPSGFEGATYWNHVQFWTRPDVTSIINAVLKSGMHQAVDSEFAPLIIVTSNTRGLQVPWQLKDVGKRRSDPVLQTALSFILAELLSNTFCYAFGRSNLNEISRKVKAGETPVISLSLAANFEADNDTVTLEFGATPGFESNSSTTWPKPGGAGLVSLNHVVARIGAEFGGYANNVPWCKSRIDPLTRVLTNIWQITGIPRGGFRL